MEVITSTEGKKQLAYEGYIYVFQKRLASGILTNAKGEETMGVMLGLRSWMIQSSMQLTITHMLLRRIM